MDAFMMLLILLTYMDLGITSELLAARMRIGIDRTLEMIVREVNEVTSYVGSYTVTLSYRY